VASTPKKRSPRTSGSRLIGGYQFAAGQAHQQVGRHRLERQVIVGRVGAEHREVVVRADRQHRRPATRDVAQQLRGCARGGPQHPVRVARRQEPGAEVAEHLLPGQCAGQIGHHAVAAPAMPGE
jgi:hypothetical protein